MLIGTLQLTLDTILASAGILLAVWAILLALRTDRHITATLGDVKTTLGKVEDVSGALTGAADQLSTVRRGVQDVTSALDASATTLSAVEQGLSTRSLGSFPDYVPDIVTVIREAQVSIVVFADLPAYAVFSTPAYWHEYRELLHDRRLKSTRPDAAFTVRIRCLSASQRRINHAGQFPPSLWNTADEPLRQRMMAPPASVGVHTEDERHAFLDRVAAFRANHPLPDDGDGPDSYERFFERLEWVHQQEEQFLAAEAIDETMPLYFWIADDRVAVFALACFTAEAREVGFLTRDPGLIEALKGIFERYDPDSRRDSSSPSTTSQG